MKDCVSKMQIGAKVEAVKNCELFHHNRPRGKRFKILKGYKGQILYKLDTNFFFGKDVIYVHDVKDCDAIFVRFGWIVFAFDARFVHEYIKERY